MYNHLKSLISQDRWLIFQDIKDLDLYCRYETNFTLTNGYMGIRGTLEEGMRGQHSGTFIAGVFNRSEAFVRELVNVQSIFDLKIYIDNKLINVESCELLEFNRVLDMKKGILFRKMKVRVSDNREIQIEGYRFLSRNNEHRAGIKYYVTPINFSGIIGFESIIDGSSVNFAWDPKFKTKHLKISDNSNFDQQGCYLETVTRDEASTNIAVGTGLRINDSKSKANICNFRRIIDCGEKSIEYCEVDAFANQTIEVDKYILTYTSREIDSTQLKNTIKVGLEAYLAEGLDSELQSHIKEYDKLWSIADIVIDGDDEADKALLFNIFHLMSSVNKNDPFVSIGANALHGERYKGHVFWDTEIFMLPFYLYTNTEAAKSLLMYRYNLLEGAKKNANQYSFKGAEYPWESADTGLEESPKWYYSHNGEVVIWAAELQYHISADVAFGVFQYYRATNDDKFMFENGLEIMFETARFWGTRLEYNEKMDRYELNNVIGPDEYHQHVDNNSYTNYMAKWNLKLALEYIKIFGAKDDHGLNEVMSKICLTQNEINNWQTVVEKIYIPHNSNSWLIEQFEGYFDKEDFVINQLDDNGMPVWPKGLSMNKVEESQLIKQADVVMLIHTLGHEFSNEIKKLNYEYYEKRTLQTSSLSPSIYSIVGIKAGYHSKAYDYFMKTANTDLLDNQGNTGDGIHAASTGGTWQVAVFGFGGLEIDKDEILCFNPWLPEKWNSMKFNFLWRDHLINVHINRENVTIKVLTGDPKNLKVKVCGELINL